MAFLDKVKLINICSKNLNWEHKQWIINSAYRLFGTPLDLGEYFHRPYLAIFLAMLYSSNFVGRSYCLTKFKFFVVSSSIICNNKWIMSLKYKVQNCTEQRWRQETDSERRNYHACKKLCSFWSLSCIYRYKMTKILRVLCEEFFTLKKMIEVVVLILPLYAAIFAILFRFRHLIKATTEVKKMFSDLVDTKANKREFLFEKIHNGEKFQMLQKL